MLSDREQAALRELERQLTREAPKLSRSFEARAQRAGDRFVKLLVVTAIVTAAVVGSLTLLVTGSSGVVLGIAIVAALIWAGWRVIRNQVTTRPPP